jgi:virginiamycin A acetyltransferase
MPSPHSNLKEGNTMPCSSILLQLYRRAGRDFIRSWMRKRIVEWEGGPAHSQTIRRIFREFYQVEIGLYTAGPCRMRPQVFHRGTSIGRYSYIADTVRTFTRNHPRNTRSTHGLFYNPALGKVKTAPLQFGRLLIGSGVWLGHNVIILPPTNRIGNGAVIAAGAVVYTNVPPYAVVTGNPAYVTGYRFNKETITRLMDSRWWEKSPQELYRDSEVIRRLVNELSLELPSGRIPSNHARVGLSCLKHTW